MAIGLVIAVVITHPSLPLPWRPNNPSLSRRSFSANYTRWDSNAESVRSPKFGFDFRPRNQNDDDDDDEEDDGFLRNTRKKRRWWSDEFDDGGILEDAIDSIWVFKVFKAYGWFFPVILASWLIWSGPKAFIMALALPLGQSVLWWLFDKLWGAAKRRPKRGARVRRKQPARATTSTKIEEEEEVEVEEEMSEPEKGKTGYQSWVVGKEEGSGFKGRKGESFGGWDDLERAKSEPRRRRDTEAKLSRRERKSDAPLFLRLLIAAFPFLSSWTKMFW